MQSKSFQDICMTSFQEYCKPIRVRLRNTHSGNITLGFAPHVVSHPSLTAQEKRFLILYVVTWASTPIRCCVVRQRSKSCWRIKPSMWGGPTRGKWAGRNMEASSMPGLQPALELGCFHKGWQIPFKVLVWISSFRTSIPKINETLVNPSKNIKKSYDYSFCHSICWCDDSCHISCFCWQGLFLKVGLVPLRVCGCLSTMKPLRALLLMLFWGIDAKHQPLTLD